MPPSDTIPPGWQRAGYTGPGMTRFEPSSGDRVTRTAENEPGGWRRAGYTSPACEQFTQVG